MERSGRWAHTIGGVGVRIFEVLCCIAMGFGLYIQHFPKKTQTNLLQIPNTDGVQGKAMTTKSEGILKRSLSHVLRRNEQRGAYNIVI